MSRRMQLGWRIAQVVNLAATAALLIGLLLRPQTALWLIWNLAIPILPATFMISPLLWRGICPLATLNEWFGGRWGQRQLAGRFLTAANASGILLLILLVPARRFLFNSNGPALATTIAIVASAAIVLGALFARRAGFCNAICPILPVERLYGQHPLLTISNSRCDRCALCVPKGCLDVAATKSFAQGIGRANERHWLATTYGAFAAAWPGVIVGYYSLDNAGWSAAPQVYLWIMLCSAASYFTTMLLVRLFELSLRTSLTLLAAVSVALYYFWAAPAIAEALHLPPVCAPILWAAALVLVGGWLRHAWPQLGTVPLERVDSP